MKEFDCFPEPDSTAVTYDEKRENPIHIVAEYSEFPIKGGPTGPVTIRGKIGGVSGNVVLPTAEGFAVQWDMGFYTERGYGIPVKRLHKFKEGWAAYSRHLERVASAAYRFEVVDSNCPEVKRRLIAEAAARR